MTLYLKYTFYFINLMMHDIVQNLKCMIQCS
jgi:hypothetical protein